MEAIQIRSPAGVNVFIFPDEEMTITSQFSVSTLTGSELMQAVEMFKNQRSLNLDGDKDDE